MLLGEDCLIGVCLEGWGNRHGDIYGRSYRVGFVDREEMISLGRLARNAPRQLIVRGTWHVVSSSFKGMGC